MKNLLLLLLLALPIIVTGQILKGTGISYFDSIPNVAPPLPKGTEIALGIKTKKLYRWDRTCSCWIELETSTDSLARTVLASGLFNQYAVPFGGSTGKLDQSAAFQFVLGQLQANSFATLGSAGAGYVGLAPQSSVPATPSSGIRVYADASGRFGWIGTNGYTRVFDASGITANRVFKLQNKTYTLADSADVAALSASLPGAYFPLAGGTLIGTGGAGFVGFPAQSSAPSAPGAGFRIFANGAGNMGVIRTDGYVTTFDFSTATGNRFFTYPANAGTFGILENTQSWTGVNTFAPSGTGSSGFIYSSTGRPAHPFGTVTTAQMNAMTGILAGDGVYNSTLKRLHIWDVSWLAIPTMASAGLGNNQVVRGDASGNLVSDANFLFDPTAAIFFTAKNSSGRGIVFDATDGTDRPNITTVGSPLWIKITAPTLILNATSNIINVGPSNSGPMTIFTNQTYFGGSNGVGIASASAVPLGLYAGNTDSNTKSFNFNSASSNSSLNTDYFYVARNSVQQFTIRGNTGAFGFGSVSPTSFAHFSPPAMNVTGDLSGAGYGLKFSMATYTNTTTPSAGTVSRASIISIDGGTFASANTSVTYSNVASLLIRNPPTSGTNSTFTNRWALQIAAGNTLLAGFVRVNDSIQEAFQYAKNSVLHSIGPTYTAPNAGAGMSFRKGGTEYMRLMENAEVFFTSSVSQIRLNDLYWIRTGSAEMTFGLAGGGSAFNGVFDFYTQQSNSASNVIRWGANSSNNAEIKTTMAYSPNTSTIEFRTFNTTIGERMRITPSGQLAINTTSPAASALVDMTATDRGLLIPRATNAQIAAVSSPTLMLMMASTTDERIYLKRTDGFYQLAYVQDIKRDTVHRVVNNNLNLSSLTSTWKTRNKRVTIETIVTAAATTNNTITLPVPTVDLVGIRFDISVEDTSGDSDISVVSFGTDGSGDGYLYNSDGTYSPSQNLFPGLGVYLGVYWCEAKSAYRWKLQ